MIIDDEIQSSLDNSLLKSLEGCAEMSSSQPILDISLPNNSQSSLVMTI